MSGAEILTTALTGQWIELHLDGCAVDWCKNGELKSAIESCKAVELSLL